MKEKKIITPNLTELYVKEYLENKNHSAELSSLKENIQNIEDELVVRGIEKIFNENQRKNYRKNESK